MSPLTRGLNLMNYRSTCDVKQRRHLVNKHEFIVMQLTIKINVNPFQILKQQFSDKFALNQ